MSENNKVEWKCDRVTVAFKDKREDITYIKGVLTAEAHANDLMIVFFEGGSSVCYHWSDVMSVTIDGHVVEPPNVTSIGGRLDG